MLNLERHRFAMLHSVSVMGIDREKYPLNFLHDSRVPDRRLAPVTRTVSHAFVVLALTNRGRDESALPGRPGDDVHGNPRAGGIAFLCSRE